MLEAEDTCSLKDAAQEPSLSAFLSDTEELFAFRYNLMQSQVFRAFHLLFSPVFLRASLCSPRTPSAHGLAQKPEAMHKYFQQLSLSLPYYFFHLYSPFATPQQCPSEPVCTTKHQKNMVSCGQVLSSRG